MMHLFEKSFAPSLATAYGPHLTTALAMAQTHLQIAIAATVPGLPKSESDTPLPRTGSAKARPSSTTSASSPLQKVSSKKTLASSTTIGGRSLSSISQTSLSSRASRILKRAGKTIPKLDFIKASLLEDAEQTISAHLDVLLGDHPCEDLTPSEVEVVITGLLKLSAIARQYYHPLPAARYVLQALQLLQDAPSHFKTNLALSELDASRRLDARLWLRCREAVVIALRDRTDGRFLEKSIGAELGSVRKHCRRAEEEATAFDDAEMSFTFSFFEALSDVSLDREDASILKKFSDLNDVAARIVDPSFSFRRLHVITLLLLGDLHKGVGALAHYKAAERIVFELMGNCGESVVWDELNTNLVSLRNIFLPSLCLVANVKLRLGLCLTRQVAMSPKSLSAAEKSVFVRQMMHAGSNWRASRLMVVHQPVRPNAPPPAVRITALPTEDLADSVIGEKPNPWLYPAVVLSAGLDVACLMAEKDRQLGAVLSLSLGLTERRLACSDGTTHREAVDTLLQAIHLMSATDCNLKLMAKSYLEVALAFLDSSSRPTPDNLASSATENSDVTKSRATSRGRESKAERVRKDRIKELEKEREKEKTAAWIAVRSAYFTRQCHAAVSALFSSSQPETAGPAFTEKDAVALPDFAKLELRGDGGLHLRNIYDASAFENQHHCHLRRSLASLPDLHNIGWTSMLRYVSVLQLSLASLSNGQVPELIASPLALPLVSRLGLLRAFLLEHFQPYACRAVAPSSVKVLHLPYNPLTKLQYPVDGTVLVSEPPPASRSGLLEPVAEEETEDDGEGVRDDGVGVCGENEICFQWYKPILGSDADSSDRVTCFYAINSKSGRVSLALSKVDVVVGQKEVSVKALTDLTGRLRSLLEDLEAKPSEASRLESELGALPETESETECAQLQVKSQPLLGVADTCRIDPQPSESEPGLLRQEAPTEMESSRYVGSRFNKCLAVMASILDNEGKPLSGKIKVEPNSENIQKILALLQLSTGALIKESPELVKFFTFVLT
eukprot:m.110675 g.110675  ORF g.110675 m.110675 type:complete len:1015 (+) comp37412_c0_seq6:7339-10383(+)